jgi:cytochrome b pre-mRNA-processing protein 3
MASHPGSVNAAPGGRGAAEGAMLQFIRSLRRAFMPTPAQLAANALYNTLVAQARRPSFYLAGGVADTLDGRFDAIVLHAFLVMRRLRDGGAAGEALSQALFDEMFADMDRSLREMGVGDMGVGKRVRAMGEAFMGRVKAYDEALGRDTANGQALEQALARNLYRSTAPAAGLALVAAYVRREAAALAEQDLDELLAGRVRFGPPPGEAAP